MDLKTAHALAQASQAAYFDEYAAMVWADASGYDQYHWFSVLDTQAMVATNDRDCVLAFRGTSEIADWVTDLDVRMVDVPFGRVHRGFKDALEHVWDEVRECVEEVPSENFYTTGHSLGAALATLALADLPSKWEMANFGSPRVGDDKFAKNLSKTHTICRFTNNNDVVPRVPLSLRYAHVGEHYHFTAFGGMLKNPSTWRLTFDRLIGRLRFRFADGVRDHSIDTYNHLLAKA